MKKRFLSALLGLSLVATLLAGCGGSDQTTSGTNAEPAAPAQSEASTDAAQTETGLQGTLKVAAFNGGYGSEIWDAVTAKFMENNPGVTIELTCEKNLEEVISPLMKAGDYPDFVYLALGRELALPETLLKDNAIMDITDVLSMQVPGEGVTVGEKIIPGFTDTLVTNPNGDGKTYLAPMFYSPCGLWYDANLLETKGWEVPQT